MMSVIRPCHGLPVVLFLFSPLIYAEGVTLGNGSSLALGDGMLSLACTDITITSGAQASVGQGAVNGVRNLINNNQLNAAQGTLEVAGDWRQLGSFIPGTSTVSLIDDCGETFVLISGSSTFYNLTATTASPRQITFAAGVTQTISNALTLTGSTGNLLNIRSSVSGQEAFLNLAVTGSQTIAFVDVADNHATGKVLAPGLPAASNSVDSGNTQRWFTNVSDLIFSDDFE